MFDLESTILIYHIALCTYFLVMLHPMSYKSHSCLASVNKIGRWTAVTALYQKQCSWL